MAVVNLSAALPYLDATSYPAGSLGARLQSLLAEIIAAAVPDGSITNAKLASDSVTSSKIAAGTVQTAKLTNNAVTLAKFVAATAQGKWLVRTSSGSGNFEEADSTSLGRSLINSADGAAARTLLGLIIGTDVQAFDAELAALAGLTSAADKLPYFTGSGAAALADFPAAGRALAATGQTKDLVLSRVDKTGTSETLSATDYGKLVTFANASAIAATLPANAAVNSQFDWIQLGAGQVTFAAASGGTLVNRQSHTKSFGQYAAGTAIVLANSGGSAAQWCLAGDTT